MKKKDKDVIRKRYFKNVNRQADLLNAFLRQEQETMPDRKGVKAEDIAELNPELITIIELSDGRYSRKRIVDVASLVTISGVRCCFFLENQELTDYRMPERIMTAESICYREKIEEIKREHTEKGDWADAAERLSGMTKTDRLLPVFSLVIYYGEERWQGAKRLHQLLDFADLPSVMQKLVGDYEIHVLEVCQFEHLEWFCTDLRQTFGFIKYAGDETALRAFVERNRENFEKLPEDAYDFIMLQTGTGKLMKLKEKCKREDGRFDMCKAIEDMVKRGQREGERTGRREGEARALQLVGRLLEEGHIQEAQKILTNKAYRNRLYKKYGL